VSFKPVEKYKPKAFFYKNRYRWKGLIGTKNLETLPKDLKAKLDMELFDPQFAKLALNELHDPTKLEQNLTQLLMMAWSRRCFSVDSYGTCTNFSNP